MITALSSEYRSVYYIDLDKDRGICYREHIHLESGLKQGEEFDYTETLKAYAKDFVSEKYREAFLKFIEPDFVRAGLEKERIITLRYTVVHDGTESYEMLRMAGVRRPEDRDDHMVHAVGMGFTDVDAETRSALSQRQALSDALVAAESANRAKTAFLSSMSHEIRTPMNAIIGLDRIALNDPNLPESTREQLQKIGSSADHLLSIINDILDMSRIEAGRMVIKDEVFSLHQLIEQAGGQEDFAVFGDFRCDLGFDGDFPVRAGQKQAVWIAFHHDALICLLDRTDSDGAGDHAQAVVDFADVDVKLHYYSSFRWAGKRDGASRTLTVVMVLYIT